MKTIEDYKFRDMVLRIGKKAVKEAQARSLRNGVPNVYSRNCKPYFELPSGEITSVIPDEYKECYK